MGMNKQKQAERREKVVRYIEDFLLSHQYPPTHAEIAKHFGITRQAMDQVLKKLEREDRIGRTSGGVRTLYVKRSL